jgi:hypothetical protein
VISLSDIFISPLEDMYDGHPGVGSMRGKLMRSIASVIL